MKFLLLDLVKEVLKLLLLISIVLKDPGSDFSEISELLHVVFLFIFFNYKIYKSLRVVIGVWW